MLNDESAGGLGDVGARAAYRRSKETWEERKKRLDDELRSAIEADFKVFLTLVWQHLGLGRPSDVQLSIADYLQHGGGDLSVIMAFRGCGKSWITGAFALWVIYCNPQEKVLIVSGNMKRAIQQTTWCLALIRDMPLLQHLAPRRDQRQSGTAFDVAPARPAQSASFSAFGITGQIVGQRAGLVIADDVETNTNSLTVMMREKLIEAVREFNAILTPGGQIKFLGTPQTNDSIYNKLPSRGYTIRIWPMVFPDDVKLKHYGELLSPWVRNRTPGHVGESTWPQRFTKEVVDRQRLAWGSSGFDLQFMLDTTLADANRFPLKLNNLIVMGLDPLKGPDDLSWGSGDDLAISGLPRMGFSGDYFHKPANIGKLFSPWNSVTAVIDPSDQGDDETALVIGAELNGRVFGLFGGGWVDGTAPATMLAIAKAIVKFRATTCIIESNFGGTMFGQLLKPYIIAEWHAWNKAHHNEHGGTEILEERAIKVQKELRIINDMQPATEGHRIVMSLAVIEADYADYMSHADGEANERYSLLFQYCNLTRDRDSLAHDDRLDAFAGLVGHYREALGVNPNLMSAQRAEDALEEELQSMLDESDEIADGVHGSITGRPASHDPTGGKLSHRHTSGSRRH